MGQINRRFRSFSLFFLSGSLLLSLGSLSHKAFAGLKEYRFLQIIKKAQLNPSLGWFSLSPRADEAGSSFPLNRWDGSTQLNHLIGFNQSHTVEGTFIQKLDPTNPKDARTFNQRYFINSDFAENESSPVFYVICGEAACDQGGFYGAVLTHAKKYKARLVALEHRFYGVSQPFPDLTPEHLRYLNTELALADLAYFQDFISEKNHWNGRWVAMGGSYSGSLAAFYRIVYPEKVVGALASSAPVEAKANFEEYDADVAETAGPECATAIREVVKKVQDSFVDPEQLAQMKHLFGADEIRDPIDFIYTLADMAATAIQYGKKDEFCTAVLKPNPIEGYAKAGKAMFDWFGTTVLEDSFQGAESILASDYSKGVGSRQWLWQSCSEFGYFQIAHSDPARSTRSPLITLDYHYQMCSKLFGLSGPVNTLKNNLLYYAPLLHPTVNRSPSNIFFTNGSTDPWQYVSITKERGNHTNSQLTTMTIAGAAHCSDLGYASSSSIAEAQKEFSGLLDQWL